ILGVAERFANAPGEVTPEASRAPLRNPDVAPPYSPLAPSADAHAALLALAQHDGWTALYDPTDPTMVTLHGSGNAVSLKDSLGRYPDAAGLAPKPLGGTGAVSTASSTWKVQGVPATNRTVIGLVRSRRALYNALFSHVDPTS